MGQHPGLGVLAGIDPIQLVGVVPTELGIADHLLQRLVEKGIPVGPVDRGMAPREEQREKVREVVFQVLLPGAVPPSGDGFCPNTFVGH